MGQCVSKKVEPEQNAILKSKIDYQNNLIDKVLERKKFHLYSIAEFGIFGPTINVKYPPMKNEYSVTILTQDNIGEEELAWYKLYNENIISLIHIEFVEKVDVFLFYTEDWDYTLAEISQINFLKDSVQGMCRVIRWMQEIAEGIKYMHLKNFYHLNICTENIVITGKDKAKIRNFHWICSSKEFNEKRIGLPKQLYPPEAFKKDQGDIVLNPEKLEVWSFGIVMANMFSGEHLTRKLPSTVNMWSKDIYPVMYEMLQKKKFHRLVEKNFSASHKSVNLEVIRRFVSYVLCFDPIHRPSVHDVIYLLNTLGIKYQLQDGSIWNKKAPFEHLEREIQGMSSDKKSSTADEKIKTYSGVGFEDDDISNDTPAKMLYADVPSNECAMGDFEQDEAKDKSNGIVALTFEHRGLNLSELSSQRKVNYENLKSENVKTAGPDPYIKDNEISSDNTDAEISLKENILNSNGTYCAEKQNCITDKTEKVADENIKEKVTRTNITAKGIFCKFVSWALDENLYSGIMHNQSYINKLSKSLTG